MLRVESVSKRFGERLALDDVSFEVTVGHVTGLVGVNGAGKTTLMRLITGIAQPDSGTVRWSSGAAPTIGYMPEERGLYPNMKVRDLVTYFGRLSGLSKGAAMAETEAVLHRVGAAEYASLQLSKLSLGNKQRVQLAVALLAQPQVLMLDEPFSGIDPLTTDDLARLMQDLAAAGTLVILSSHQLELIQKYCSSLVVLHGGRLVAAGETRPLLASFQPFQVFELDIAGVDESWLQGFSELSVVERSGTLWTISAPNDFELSTLIKHATSVGELHQARIAPARLVDLLRAATV